MARAMSASGDLNPNATREGQADLGVDGLDAAVGQALGEGGLDVGPVPGDRLGQLHEGGDAAAPGPGQPRLEQHGGPHTLEREHQPEFFLQQVGAVEAVVDLGDPGEFGALVGGQVARVLPQRIAGTFELARQGSLPVLAGRVPDLAAHLVQRVGGPLGRRGTGPGRALLGGSARPPRSRSRGRRRR